MPYDPNLPLLLATDASNVGLGAVLSHRLENGQVRHIAYDRQRGRRTDRQRGLGYLYARRWTLITDHKPLTQILQHNQSLPTLCISRMVNYADFLSNFNFNIIYRP